MRKPSNIQLTSAEVKIVDHAWYHLLRSVESTITQEKRLRNCYKVETKNFGSTFAKVYVMQAVLKGMAPAHINLLNICEEDDERMLAFMVGVWIAKKYPERALEIAVQMNYGYNAYNAAYNRWIEEQESV